jgi:diguanylate cyclase (GGDEF)-like protein
VLSLRAPDPSRVASVAPFAGVAFLGIAVLAGPAAADQPLELSIGAALTVLVVAALLFAPPPRSGFLALVLPAVAYLAVVALLRDATRGSGGGGAVLVLLPVFAVALHGTRAALWAVIVALVLTLTIPVLAIGGANYPLAGIRSATLFGAIAVVLGLSVQSLVAELRARQVERERLLERLSRLAHTDMLTGLPNRRGWAEALDRGPSTTQSPLAACAAAVLDLDHFKAINDTQGHAAGDRLLRTVAAAWRDALRPGDVLARLGGDEFGLLLPDTGSGEARAIVERLCALVPGPTTCSAGVASWDGRETADQVVSRADRLLYVAKANGRGQVVADDGPLEASDAQVDLYHAEPTTG